MTLTPQVVILGAGAAGMTAAIELAHAGMAVQILEARERIGGRMYTERDPIVQAPIELGAEFIHGRPREIWQPLREHHIGISEIDGDTWCLETGRLQPCDFFPEVDEILARMDDHGPDESFLDFLHRCFPDSEDESLARKKAKQRARSYVTGFNAADPSQVSVHWLVQEMRAEEKIEGDRAFRAEHGYADLIEIFRKDLHHAGVEPQLSMVAETIRWASRQVQIAGSGPGGHFSISAPQALITLPAGVLQATQPERGAVQFIPPLPPPKYSALEQIVMGKVIRVTLRFRERFWESLTPYAESSQSLAHMGFLFSQNDTEWFPTWWTAMPQLHPLLTGWAPFHCAEKLSGQSKDFVQEKALETLSHLLPIRPQKLRSLLDAVYVHDWQNDPFSRGAYSYVKVGGKDSPATLAEEVKSTLFFAGEATDIGGNTGTVHGAIASGMRAAKEILSTQR